MTVELELCPECKKGHLKPTGQAGTTGSIRIFVCDNDNCGTKVMKAEKD